MSTSDLWRINTTTLVLLVFLNLGLFTLNNRVAWLVLGLILLIGSLYLSFRQGMAYGHEACALLETVKKTQDPESPAYGQVDAKVAKRAWSVGHGLRAALSFALPAYVIGCLYIATSLLEVDSVALPLRFVSWILAAPYWPCVLAWTHTFDRLTGWVVAVLMISPFVLPGVTFAGYMQGPKLWAKSEKAMAEGKRRAKAKSRVVRKKRTPRAQKPEI